MQLLFFVGNSASVIIIGAVLGTFAALVIIGLIVALVIIILVVYLNKGKSNKYRTETEKGVNVGKFCDYKEIMIDSIQVKP